MQMELKISGMHCKACAAAVARTLKKLDGVTDAQADFEAGSAQISFDATAPERSAIAKAIDSLGFKLEG